MNNKNIITLVVVSLVVGIAAFYGGMTYAQRQRVPITASGFRNNMNSRNSAQPGMYRFGGQNGERPVSGEIVSGDDKTLTVKMNDGSTKIIILSQTTSINKASQGSVADLVKGERVLVVGKTNLDGSITAQNIQLNPPMRMMGGASAVPSASPAR